MVVLTRNNDDNLQQFKIFREPQPFIDNSSNVVTSSAVLSIPDGVSAEITTITDHLTAVFKKETELLKALFEKNIGMLLKQMNHLNNEVKVLNDFVKSSNSTFSSKLNSSSTITKSPNNIFDITNQTSIKSISSNPKKTSKYKHESVLFCS